MREYFNHQSVLKNEVCEFFGDRDGVIVDATLGLGGHSFALLESNPNISIIGIDKDKEALKYSSHLLSCFGERFCALHSSNAQGIKQILDTCKQISGILADIGISSYQIDNPKRGFGFYADSLDMRMDTDSMLTAKTIINSYSRDELNRIFVDYGEINNPNHITKLIMDYRKNHTIESAMELSTFLQSKIQGKPKIHPATLVFQALRIEVNDELNELSQFLDNISHLRGTKLAIISFHSLEDRIIKERFKLWAKNCICPQDTMKCLCGNANARGEILTKKPIVPKDDEIKQNKRSRSAKMRCFKFYE